VASVDDVPFSWLRPLRAQLSSLASSPIFVAYSGGLDSTCLLHLLCQLHPAQTIVALHVHHGLSPNADAWLAHCQHVASAWGCEFIAHRVRVVSCGEGTEAAARSARYGIFSNVLMAGGVLLQGHHGDDQLETVLLHLLRGSGPAGLRGIPEARRCGNGQIMRPMLAVTRAQLEAYASYFGLTYIHDESNQNLVFDRNYLRSAVVPLLQHRFEHVHGAVGATVEAMADAEQIQRDMAWQDAEICQPVMPIAKLTALPPVRQRNVLRHWFAHHTQQSLPRRLLQQCLDSVLSAKEDALPSIQIGEWFIQRSRQQLVVRPLVDPSADWQMEWDFMSPLITPFGTLMAEPIVGGWQLPSVVQVRHRRGGEHLRPLGRGITKSLKSLFKERDIPIWQRATMPLLWRGETLLCVADMVVDESCRPNAGQMGWRLKWQPQFLAHET
jgi:tRNA(Ile)-lysidine synthase